MSTDEKVVLLGAKGGNVMALLYVTRRQVAFSQLQCPATCETNTKKMHGPQRFFLKVLKKGLGKGTVAFTLHGIFCYRERTDACPSGNFMITPPT